MSIRLEIQDVGLDAEPRAFKRRPVAHIRHCLKAASVDCQSRDVDAERGQQLGIRREIDGRHKKPRAHTASTRLRGAYAKRPPQHPARSLDVACGDQRTHRGTRNLKAVHTDGGMYVDRKAELCAEGLETP